ncbi:DUF1559 domain-containing protein [Mariniblastus sp.]|nr:DUF1559 domain-containing protein [Mariniblastus sp.]
MLQLLLRASCALSLSILMLAQPQTGTAQQVNADWYKRVAPEKCVSYIAWNNDPEKPIEGNATQALMAEPEVKAFVEDLKLRAGLMAPAMMSEEGMPKEKVELLHSLSPKLVASIFERSGCLFVEEVTMTRNMEALPVIKAAMLIDLGDDADKFISQMVEMISEKDQPTPKVELAGTQAYKVELQESAGTLYFGNAGQIMVVAIGEQTYSNAVERMKGASQPAWLTKLDQQSQSLKHVHSMAFLDMKSVLRSVRKAAGPNTNVVSELLGVSNVDQIQMVSGLDAEGSVTHVLFDAVDVEGVLGLLTKYPVKDSHFEDVPKDSLGALALTLDNDGLLDLIRTAETIMGGQGSDFGRFKQEMLENTGVDLEDDVIRSLGNSWVLFNGASDGWVSGLTLIGDVKDSKKLTTAVESFFKTVGQQVKEIPARYRPGLFKQSYEGETIYSMTFPEVFVETSLCIKQDRIYIGMFPQAIKTAIKALPSDEVLLDDMQVKKLSESKFLEGTTKLSGMIYLDANLQTQMTYPYLQFMKSGASTMFAGDLNPDMAALLNGMELPPARTVIPKIKPTMILVRTSDQGIEIEARQTIPSNSAAIGMPIMVGMLLPAVGSVRQAAMDTTSLNNLRQISLASLNHESAFMRMPSDGPIDGNEDNFSWRVRILPFIEQNNLYDQIKFDEPWDSDHNKSVLAKTPDVFKSPGRDLPEGMTVYRGFGGEKGLGVLGGKDGKGARIGSISDGTSNTILVAEVPDEMATHWAKPGLLDVSEDVVKEMLKAKDLLVTFVDGSTHRIPATIEPKELLKLLGKNEGAIPNFDFNQRNDRRRQRQQDRDREADPRFVLPGQKESF